VITEKKILLISPASKVGGKASFTNILIQELGKYNVNFIHIDLVRAKSNYVAIRVGEHIFSFFIYKIKLLIILLTKPIDIVQVHTSSFYDFYDNSIFILISKLFQKRIIVRYGGASFPTFYNISYSYSKKFIRRILHSVDTLIVQSEYWKDYFISSGLKNGKVFILPNFVDEKKFLPNKKGNFDDSIIKVLFMPAQALKRKGFFDLIEAIKNIAHTNPHLKFHIVGSNVSKYISTKNIITYKEIRGEKKVNHFNSSHIYLLPTYAEGFPNSLLEAMAAGMAVITTNIPQISCLAEDGKEFLLMNPGSSTEFERLLTGLMNDKNRIKELGTNARKLVEEKYSQRLMAGYLKELYNG